MSSEWFYMKGADKRGPVNSSRLRELAQSGELLPTDLVWREGMKDWKRARKIDGLFDAKEESSPTSTASKLVPPAPPSNLLGISAVPNRPLPPPSNLHGGAASTPSGPTTNISPPYWPTPAQPVSANASPIAAPAGPDGNPSLPVLPRANGG